MQLTAFQLRNSECLSSDMRHKQNKPEEHRLWAIINVKEPQYPQYIKVINPPITIPIWATEE